MPLVSSCWIYCQFSELTKEFLASNPLTQFALSNLRLQPDTLFAVDMFPYKKTELFQKSGFLSKPAKSQEIRHFLLLIYIFSIKQTLSVCFVNGKLSKALILVTAYPFSCINSRLSISVLGLHEM